jgi:hypothetical protein
MRSCESGFDTGLLPLSPHGNSTDLGPAEPKASSKRVSRAVTAVAILLLSACGSNPPIISGDTSCERFRHISATPAQIKVFADNWEVMETYADAVVAHNIEYDRHCLGVAP